jgi:arylsulfatase
MSSTTEKESYAMANNKQPNILILWGDDVGWWNISYNSRGQMGYRTPNIDRVANEGVAFTDYYAQQSCTAGRAAFITGQNPIRTGLTKVGMPGADVGLQKEDPTIAELLKPLGYTTGQFGKNHLGDKKRVPADDARLRRVLRQPLPLECRGRARGCGLPEEPGV